MAGAGFEVGTPPREDSLPSHADAVVLSHPRIAPDPSDRLPGGQARGARTERVRVPPAAHSQPEADVATRTLLVAQQPIATETRGHQRVRKILLLRLRPHGRAERLRRDRRPRREHAGELALLEHERHPVPVSRTGIQPVQGDSATQLRAVETEPAPVPHREPGATVEREPQRERSPRGGAALLLPCCRRVRHAGVRGDATAGEGGRTPAAEHERRERDARERSQTRHRKPS